MHPGIRIVTFLVFTACLSRATAGQLLLASALLVFPYIRSGTSLLSRALGMFRRLRWFFLSIVVLYLWMAPPDSPSFLLPDFLPAGIGPALERILSLVLIVLAVNYLLASLPQAQLIAAIYWLAAPLKYPGLLRERLALRLVMTIEAVGKLAQVSRPRPTSGTQPESGWRFYQRSYRRLIHTLQFYYRHAQEQAASAAGQEYRFDCLDSPPLWQWGSPLLLYGLFLLARG